jgi:hypothetical protein
MGQAISIWAISGLLFVGTALIFQHHYSQLVQQFGDSAAYINIANAISGWNFAGIQVKHFWGLPYAVAGTSKLLGTSCLWSLVVVSVVASLCSLFLAHRLWGGRIAICSLLLNFDWFQRSFLGGSEPLFLALLFGSFLMIRRGRWYWASLLGSLATITRPLGLFVLIGIGVTLFIRHSWRQLTWSIGIAASIGIAYVVPLHLYLHDSLATVHSYGVMQSSPLPPLFGIPFKAIIMGTILYPPPLTNLLLTSGWIVLVLTGNVLMFLNKRFRGYAKDHLPEVIFLGLYLLALYSYNLPVFARGTFPRFAIPILPFVFLSMSEWLPKDKRVWGCLAMLAAVLAACSAIGIRNVRGFHGSEGIAGSEWSEKGVGHPNVGTPPPTSKGQMLAALIKDQEGFSVGPTPAAAALAEAAPLLCPLAGDSGVAAFFSLSTTRWFRQ